MVLQVKRYLWDMAGRLEELADTMSTKAGRIGLFDSLMAKHDENKDGVLTQEEFYLGHVPYFEDDVEIEESVKEEL